MDLVSRALTGPARYFLNGLGVVSFVAVGVVIVHQSRAAIAEFTHLSQVAEIPMAWMHAAIPAAFALILLGLLIPLRGHLDGTLEPSIGQEIDRAGSDEPDRKD
jgi:TRAP-type C4-dicarboxylate transport system permease small subunit